MKIQSKFYDRFVVTLEEWHKDYDADIKMLKSKFTTPGYHTTLKEGTVHRTRESLTYAVALMDSEIEENISRSCDVIKQVLKLQDTNPPNSTYGIWPWFYEESLEQMAPPDWNWANFCAKHLLEIAISHGVKLSEDLKSDIKDSVFHAANSIIRRNVGPEYTNIAVMAVFITLIAGKLYDWKDISLYGQRCLKSIHEHTMAKGTFNEYNSPTYTVIVLEELARLLNYVQNEEHLEHIRDLYQIGWKCLATHFHLPTRQWAGPHARCYNSLQDNRFLTMIQMVTQEKVKFLKDEDLDFNLEWFGLNMVCPDEFLDYFKKPQYPRCEYEIFEVGNGIFPSRAATCYLDDKFTLGTFSHLDLWNQRRALIAYWGDYEQPKYMHLRCLHDGYDYCSAFMTATQYEGNVLAAINFATDRGDTHVCLDMVENATIMAKDFRIRLELGGIFEDVEEKWNGNALSCKVGEVFININMVYCNFGNYKISYEVVTDSHNTYFDIVLFSGEERKINFSNLDEAVCIFSVSLNGFEDRMPSHEKIEVQKSDDLLICEWDIDTQKLKLQATTMALTADEIFVKSRSREEI